MTAREVDVNGWMEVKGNPLSKVGVFPYMGSMADPDGALGLDPNEVYQVYRSAEELSDQETIESFKLVPWIDDHVMLDNEILGMTSPDEKGVRGVVGEEVYFEAPYLRGNIKLFSGEMEDKVNDGKTELSCGYRCEYVREEGMFGDQHYTLAQRNIRGNHLASVDAGRMGADVAVLDQRLTFTVDSKDLKPMPDEEKEETAEDTSEETETKDTGGGSEELGQDQEEEEKEKSAEDEEEEEESKGEDIESSSESTDAMDQMLALKKDFKAFKKNGAKQFMRALRKRDALYAKVSTHIGAFDHAEMDVDDLAAYACDKLSLKPPKGHEVTAVEAYFHNRPAAAAFTPGATSGMAMDSASKPRSEAVDSYFGGGK